MCVKIRVQNLHISDSMKKYVPFTRMSSSQAFMHVLASLSLSFFKDCDHTVTMSVQNVQFDVHANGSSVSGFTGGKF